MKVVPVSHRKLVEYVTEAKYGCRSICTQLARRYQLRGLSLLLKVIDAVAYTLCSLIPTRIRKPPVTKQNVLPSDRASPAPTTVLAKQSTVRFPRTMHLLRILLNVNSDSART